MDGIDAEHFDGLDFSEGAGGAQLHDVGGADPGEQKQGRGQGSQFADHGGDHHRAQELVRADAGEDRHGLPDDDEAQADREEKGEWKQPQPRAIDLPKGEGEHDLPGRAEFADDDAKRDQPKRSQRMDGLNEQHQLAPDVPDVGTRHGPSPEECRVGFLLRGSYAGLHGPKLGSSYSPVNCKRGTEVAGRRSAFDQAARGPARFLLLSATME
jgi:hypothetical protein